MTKQFARTVLRNLGEHWRIPTSDWPKILSRSKSTVFAWLQEGNEQATLDAEVTERLSHIVSIYNGLHLLFGDGPFADEWMHVKNRAFGGTAPIDLVKTGRFTDLLRVRAYVDRSNAR